MDQVSKTEPCPPAGPPNVPRVNHEPEAGHQSRWQRQDSVVRVGQEDHLLGHL